MPRLIPKNELDDIKHSLSFFPEGASLNEIKLKLKLPLPIYTLQRRLAFMINEGQVFTEGKARALRYKLQSTNEKVNEEQFVLKEQIISLSTSSEDIQRRISQPVQARIPVGYNRQFLDQYRPNVSSYLSESTCERLYKLGKTDGERPAGTYARQIFNRLLIDLSWNSSRLEGNTYSLLETERLLNLSEIVDGKDLKEAQMILNHKEAIEFLVDSAIDIGINRFTIFNLHALLSNGLLGPEACGRLRSIAVGIGRSVYQPLAIPQLVEENFRQILDTASVIKNPFEQAFFLMVQLPYLQPFEDVNKRVSRLAANIPLIKHNLCPLSFVDVPQSVYINGLLGVYELNRIELLRDIFVWAYERSCLRYSATRRELGDPDPFRIRYRTMITEIVAGVVREYLNKTQAIAVIRDYSQKFIPSEDQARFIETVERELMSLHEGNIARHRLRLSEFNAWEEGWQ
jgi:hypothetical protein